MLKPLELAGPGLAALSFFAVLGGLVLLVGANHAAPGCTGPEVPRCDFVEVATDAVARSQHHPFQSSLGFELYDQGSSVLVQQYTPPGEPSLNHAPSVLIDRRSCRVCSVDWQWMTDGDPRSPYVGRLITRVPAEDQVAAAARAEYWEGGPGGIAEL